MTGDETSARAGLAEVLGRHVWDAPSYDAYYVEGCECGWTVSLGERKVWDVYLAQEYLDHLADVVLAYLAERLGSTEVRRAIEVGINAADGFETTQALTDAALAAVAAGLGVALGDAGDVGGPQIAAERVVEDVAGEWEGLG